MRAAAALLLAAFALGASAATPPPPPKIPSPAARAMSNVYLFAHAGAILEICLANPARTSLAPGRAEALSALSGRLSALVDAMAAYQRDRSLVAVFESTRSSLAADPKLVAHTRDRHGNCNDRFTSEMTAYVAENEALIRRFLEQGRTETRKGAPKPP